MSFSHEVTYHVFAVDGKNHSTQVRIGTFTFPTNTYWKAIAQEALTRVVKKAGRYAVVAPDGDYVGVSFFDVEEEPVEPIKPRLKLVGA